MWQKIFIRPLCLNKLISKSFQLNPASFVSSVRIEPQKTIDANRKLVVSRPIVQKLIKIPLTPTEIVKRIETPNYYKLLGVNKNANSKDIKAAYYELAKQYHPDTKDLLKSLEGNRQFQAINEAYEILNDDSKRFEYDKYGFVKERAPKLPPLNTRSKLMHGRNMLVEIQQNSALCLGIYCINNYCFK